MNDSATFLNKLTQKTLALVLAGGRGSRLHQLTDWRAKPAVPFGGKFRIIDFPLSNCMNSKIRRIGVITQYKSHSLIRHIQKGWGFLRGEFGEFVELLPAQQRLQESWYSGTANAVYQNLDIIRNHKPEYVLILAGDHIYKMDYSTMLAEHVKRKADLTVACLEVPLSMASSFGIMEVNKKGNIKTFTEKPEKPIALPNNPECALASMGIYIFNTDFLYDQLVIDATCEHSSHDFGKDIIPKLIKHHKVIAYPFRDVQNTGKSGYWRDVGTVDAYWEANMELIGVTPPLNLYDRDWSIWTYQEQLPPAKFVFNDDGRRGMAVDSMVSGGCIISGAMIENSLLFSNVIVNDYSTLKDCVILPDVRIGQHCRLNKVIIDKGCYIEAGTVIGEDLAEDAKRFYVSEKGVVLVTPEMLTQYIHESPTDYPRIRTKDSLVPLAEPPVLTNHPSHHTAKKGKKKSQKNPQLL
ncbi:glucose-1-phosphate adenylyltransferase [Beggiatoa alba B18LD]|uniref:Glucose-1-phosphate adenylyltransferase n=1 Tax=Beggiatoa alba B18LD TaxID=395493 RepID=I3CFY7_9GAMM|nr:glucose-1-phosphate adenylyltransferase [Beggiatoa alba B18LD]